MKKVLLTASLLFAGCVSSSDLQKLELQLNDLQDDISELKRQSSSKDDVQRLNTSLTSQVERAVKTTADTSVKVNDLDDKVQNVQGSIEQTNHRIDRIVQQVTRLERDVADLQNTSMSRTPVTAVPGAATPDPGAGDNVTVTPSSPSEDPLATYQSAYKDYQRGNYDLAIEGFRDFLTKNANSDLADNAAYWVGESLFSQKKYQPAIDQFNKVINSYPKSDKVPASLLKKGYAYIELGEKAQGVVQLQYVVHEHPRSQEASLARQKLKALGIESK
jgi:tol-pal system protein YbgF